MKVAPLELSKNSQVGIFLRGKDPFFVIGLSPAFSEAQRIKLNLYTMLILLVKLSHFVLSIVYFCFLQNIT